MNLGKFSSTRKSNWPWLGAGAIALASLSSYAAWQVHHSELLKPVRVSTSWISNLKKVSVGVKKTDPRDSKFLSHSELNPKPVFQVSGALIARLNQPVDQLRYTASQIKSVGPQMALNEASAEKVSYIKEVEVRSPFSQMLSQFRKIRVEYAIAMNADLHKKVMLARAEKKAAKQSIIASNQSSHSKKSSSNVNTQVSTQKTEGSYEILDRLAAQSLLDQVRLTQAQLDNGLSIQSEYSESDDDLSVYQGVEKSQVRSDGQEVEKVVQQRAPPQTQVAQMKDPLPNPSHSSVEILPGGRLRVHHRKQGHEKTNSGLQLQENTAKSKMNTQNGYSLSGGAWRAEQGGFTGMNTQNEEMSTHAEDDSFVPGSLADRVQKLRQERPYEFQFENDSNERVTDAGVLVRSVESKQSSSQSSQDKDSLYKGEVYPAEVQANQSGGSILTLGNLDSTQRQKPVFGPSTPSGFSKLNPQSATTTQTLASNGSQNDSTSKGAKTSFFSVGGELNETSTQAQSNTENETPIEITAQKTQTKKILSLEDLNFEGAFEPEPESLQGYFEIMSDEGEIGFETHAKWVLAKPAQKNYQPTLFRFHPKQSERKVRVLARSNLELLSSLRSSTSPEHFGTIFGRIPKNTSIEIGVGRTGLTSSGVVGSVIYFAADENGELKKDRFGALVEVNELDTNQDRFFIAMNIPPGLHLLYLNRFGDDRQIKDYASIDVIVKKQTQSYVNLTQLQSVRVAGAVLNGDSPFKDPIEGARVHVVGQDKWATTDEEGYFEIEGVLGFKHMPLFVETMTEREPVHRYKLRDYQFDSALLFRFNDPSLFEGFNLQQGHIVGAVHLGENYRSRMIHAQVGHVFEEEDSVLTDDELNRSPGKVYTLRSTGGEKLSGQPIDLNHPRFLITEVPEGAVIAQMKDESENPVWSELIPTSPGVVSVVGP